MTAYPDDKMAMVFILLSLEVALILEDERAALPGAYGTHLTKGVLRLRVLAKWLVQLISHCMLRLNRVIIRELMARLRQTDTAQGLSFRII